MSIEYLTGCTCLKRVERDHPTPSLPSSSGGPLMRLRLWQALDNVAHIVYQPTAFGHRACGLRWHHRLHLIPARALGWVCVRYDDALGVTE